jgi:hypothetical protein
VGNLSRAVFGSQGEAFMLKWLASSIGTARFSNLVHWGYGTGWGAMRGIIGATGLRGTPAAALFFAAVWGTELTTLPTLGVAPPATEWGRDEIAIDAGHHLVYAVVASLVYEGMDR